MFGLLFGGRAGTSPDGSGLSVDPDPSLTMDFESLGHVRIEEGKKIEPVGSDQILAPAKVSYPSLLIVRWGVSVLPPLGLPLSLCLQVDSQDDKSKKETDTNHALHGWGGVGLLLSSWESSWRGSGLDGRRIGNTATAQRTGGDVWRVAVFGSHGETEAGAPAR